ncbi:hypothetical protein H9P43_005248 [Blastocladiella emersonii ATCC 22665]|nr:hypothetical protein H9P43_005248 [Blastocladiella emersonii ATCC 22665]
MNHHPHYATSSDGLLAVATSAAVYSSSSTATSSTQPALGSPSLLAASSTGMLAPPSPMQSPHLASSTSPNPSPLLTPTMGPSPTTSAGSFVHKLFKLVNDPTTDALIRWTANGESFVVTDVPEFEKVLPRYYKHRQFSSFVRQLNMYGFHKTNRAVRGNARNAAGEQQPAQQEFEFAHASFLRGRPDLLETIRRKTNESSASGNQQPVSAAASPAQRAAPAPASPLPMAALDPGFLSPYSLDTTAVPGTPTSSNGTTSPHTGTSSAADAAAVQAHLVHVHSRINDLTLQLAEQKRESDRHAHAITAIMQWIQAQGITSFPPVPGVAGVDPASLLGPPPTSNGNYYPPQPSLQVTGPAGELLSASSPHQHSDTGGAVSPAALAAALAMASSASNSPNPTTAAAAAAAAAAAMGHYSPSMAESSVSPTAMPHLALSPHLSASMSSLDMASVNAAAAAAAAASAAAAAAVSADARHLSFNNPGYDNGAAASMMAMSAELGGAGFNGQHHQYYGQQPQQPQQQQYHYQQQ